ncbi:MAG: PhoH family protein [Bacteroidales bacterium]|jgi:PhoH-like ATPase|nr:PhoH family protein [Bacteroidales bacterium]MBQ3941682.1 PhoH family protein [Bacteroidales bacterium]MBQ4026839.1 PhoH family protein [Bacteroidales bacterium]MBQ4201146.1 PhoH family protein [Bacteroidales bacterium]
MGKSKIYVLDTNVILHDHKAIWKFKDNDLVIPTAVIEEADKFKKGNDTLSYHARGFMRELDLISDGHSFGKKGIPIGKGLGRIKVEPNHPFPPELSELFKDDTQDHRILATAIWVRDNNPGTFVALVTKDVNLRLKSKAAGMAVQDYLSDKIEEDKLENRQREVLRMSLRSDLMQALCYGPETSIDWKDVQELKPEPNQLFRFEWESGSDDTACARYDADRGKIVLVKSREAYGIRPRNDEQKMALDACLNPKVSLVALTGGAGTGKTLLALASALEQERDYEQIILSRPTVILGNQDIGFLPGDQKSKMSPFLQPLMDNLNVIKEQFRPGSREAQRIEAMLTMEKLVIEPLAYIRGRSLGKCFFIIDEAQNLTPHEIKTIITRAGEGTKMVFTGDVFQIDQPYLDQWTNGLSHIAEKLSGQKLFEHVFLRKGERSALSDLAAKLL